MIKMTILAFLGSVFPVILFNIDRKKIIYAGIGGALGWIIYSLTLSYTNNTIIGSFAGAFIVNIYSEAMARIKKTPASMFYVPGIFPLVPGITAYNALNYAVQGYIDLSIREAGLALSIGGAIAFGIMLSFTIIKFINKLINHYLKKDTEIILTDKKFS